MKSNKHRRQSLDMLQVSLILFSLMWAQSQYTPIFFVPRIMWTKEKLSLAWTTWILLLCLDRKRTLLSQAVIILFFITPRIPPFPGANQDLLESVIEIWSILNLTTITLNKKSSIYFMTLTVKSRHATRWFYWTMINPFVPSAPRG